MELFGLIRSSLNLFSNIPSQRYEVEEVFAESPKFRFVQKGNRKGEDVYMALGQTVGGRYLTVLFICKQNKEALVLSAREMAHKEKKIYGRK